MLLLVTLLWLQLPMSSSGVQNQDMVRVADEVLGSQLSALARSAQGFAQLAAENVGELNEPGLLSSRFVQPVGSTRSERATRELDSAGRAAGVESEEVAGVLVAEVSGLSASASDGVGSGGAPPSALSRLLETDAGVEAGFRGGAVEDAEELVSSSRPQSVVDIDPAGNAIELQMPVEASALESVTMQSRGQRLLESIPYPWQTLGYEIDFLSPRQGYRGLTYPYDKKIEIFIDAEMSDAFILHVLAHEIGHAVDVELNSGSDRGRWFAGRGLPANTQWWVGDGVSDFGSGSGDFAECFSAWLVGSTSKSILAGSCSGTEELIEELSRQ